MNAPLYTTSGFNDSERRNEMNMSPYSVFSGFYDFCTTHDVFGAIKRQESQRAQARKNARRQRARELTKARELEIKKAKGENNADE